MSKVGLKIESDELRIESVPPDQILNLWDELWPDRIGRHELISCMSFDGGIDAKIKDTYCPQFWLACFKNGPVGCLSGHLTAPGFFRVRGLFVAVAYRRRGVSQMLFKKAQQVAILEGAQVLWSYPRLSAIEAYKKFGFITEDRQLIPGQQNHYARLNLDLKCAPRVSNDEL